MKPNIFLKASALVVCSSIVMSVLASCSERQPVIKEPQAESSSVITEFNAQQAPSSHQQSQAVQATSMEAVHSSSTQAQQPSSSNAQQSASSSSSEAVKATPAAAGNDYDYITNHISLPMPQSLTIFRPSGDITTSSKDYCLTGSSNPNAELYLNGSLVESRGIRGSFSIYVTLSQGENVFEFKQGEIVKTVTITQNSSYSTAATSKVITGMFPSTDTAVESGSSVKLKCTAPSGSSVTATVGGQSIQLDQVTNAQPGVPVIFSTSYNPQEVSGTKNAGAVTYTLNYNGSTRNFTSGGKLFIVGSGSQLTVQVKNLVSNIFAADNDASAYISTAKKGAVDYVTEIGGSMYKLSMGGWILKDTVQPLTSAPNLTNTVSSASLYKDQKGEGLILAGTSNPMYKASQDNSNLYITLYNTSGVGTIDSSASSMFSDVSASEQGGNTTITFSLKNSGSLWGYVVEYNEGKTTIYCKARPYRASGPRILAGITVTLDPGHGGIDTGALGIPFVKGPTEKQINLATATAVKKRLESLGATVLMTRTGDGSPDLNERMQESQNLRADFYVSLHCNSVANVGNFAKPNGVEVYYYNDMSKPFANSLATKVPNYTGRTYRGIKHSYFRVTLNSYAPSVLVEMGYLLNARDYDSLCSKKGIYNTANAISDSIASLL